MKRVLLFILAIVIFTTCEKEDNPTPSSTDTFRISQMARITSEYISESHFSYSGNRLVEINEYRSDESGELILNGTSVFNYNGNYVTADITTVNYSGVFAPVSYREYEIDNGQVIGCTGIWGDDYYNYTYSGDKITEMVEDRIDDISREKKDVFKIIFEYNNDLLTKANTFS
ncbi:hypothetical protein [Carboxylicivirga marina]|uniref:DUF4595 domain-containing protein n=1 Tax=Carboxylicivirga marina TaxID=2800988 RepID=A0ABS1HF94_9BACT|nr:hypothetical protein [Carboxylicivirga marina]MBK3515968.1 hypothetical protein [Carboxylicivirga marina]